MTSTAAALQALKVEKRFGEFEVLRGVNLTVVRGATQALIGPNGAGKTTLINVLSGLLKPNAGSIVLDDEDITHSPPYHIARRGLIRTFQITSLFGDLSVADNLEVALVARNKYRKSANNHDDTVSTVYPIAKLLNLDTVIHEKVDNLSHGDQRLLELGVALSLRPSVLLMDEPTAGMSPAETHGFVDVINTRLKGRYTIVLVEHDMDVVMKTADCISVLENGRVIAHGAPAEIVENPRVQEAYLGRA